MACVIVDKQTDIYKYKRAFGSSILDFKNDRSRWPDSLIAYYQSIPSATSLTVAMMIDWLGQQSGIRELREGSDEHSGFVTLLGRYTRLKGKPGGSAAENVLLLTALAYCRVIEYEGRALTEAVQLARMLNGRNPFGESD